MPEAYRYAFAVTMSGREDLPSDVFKAAQAWFAKCRYHAVVREADEKGRVHLHAGVIFENAKKPSNVKACLMYPKVVRDWVANNNAKHCLQVKPMASEYWLTTYMQKDGPMEICNFPDDLADVAYAFAHEKEQKKQTNPEYAKWARMYHDDERRMPAHEHSVYEFFHYHMYIADDLKICPDQKRLKDRCLCLVEYLNKRSVSELYNGLQRPQEDIVEERMLRLDAARDRDRRRMIGPHSSTDGER